MGESINVRFKRGVALVLVVVMTGCQTGSGLRQTSAATGTSLTSERPATLATPQRGGLEPVCMQMGGMGGGGSLLFILGGYMLVAAPFALIGLILKPFEVVLDRLRWR